MRIPRKFLCLALSAVLPSSSALAWHDDDRLSYNPNQNRDYGSSYRFQEQQGRVDSYQPQPQFSLPVQLQLPSYSYGDAHFASTLPRQETWRAPAFSFTAATPDFSTLSNSRSTPDLSRVQDFSRAADSNPGNFSPRPDAIEIPRPDAASALPLVSQPAAELTRMSSSLLPGAMALDAARSVLSRPAAPEPQPLRLDDLDLPVSYTRPPAPPPIPALSVPLLLHNAHQALARLATAASDAVHLRRQLPAADLPDGSRLRGNITLNHDGSLQRVAPGTLRTVGSAPITLSGETWKYGEFQYQGNAWNLKGPGTQLVPELKGYDLKGQTIDRRQFGDGQGNRVSQGYGPAQGGDGKIADLSTGLSAEHAGNAWRFTPGQTGKLLLEGQVLNLKIDEKGKLSAPALVTLSQGGVERAFQIQGVAPHLDTGGVELLAKVDLAPGETLKVQGLSGREPGYQGPPEEPLLRQAAALPGDQVPAATIKIRQEGDSYVIQGQAAVALVTAPATPQSQTLAHITALLPEYSQLNVTGKTSFPQGISIHTGPAKVGTFGNKIEPQSGAIYQTPADQTPRLYQKRLTSDAAVQNFDPANGTFTAVMGHDSGGLDTQEWIFITKLEVPGVIDKDTGQARLVDGRYRAQAWMNFTQGDDKSLKGIYEGHLGILVKDSEVFIRALGNNADPKKEDNGWRLKSESTFKPGLPITALAEAAATTATRGRRDPASRLKEAAIAVLASPGTGIEKRARALWNAAGNRVGKAVERLGEEARAFRAARKPATVRTTPEAATAIVKTLTPAPRGEALRKSYDWTVAQTKSAMTRTENAISQTYQAGKAKAAAYWQDTKTIFEHGTEKFFNGAQTVHRGFQVAAQQPVSQNVSDVGGAIVDSFTVTKNPVQAIKIIVDAPFNFLSGDMFDKQDPVAFDPRKDAPALVTTTGMACRDFDMRRFNSLVNEALGIEKSTLVTNLTHINLPKIGNFEFMVGLGDVLAQAVGDELLGGTSINSIHAAQALKKGIEEKGAVFNAGHSQGVAIDRRSYDLLSSEDRSKVYALGMGSEWTINGKAIGLGSSYNARNSEDPIPYVGMMLGLAGNFLPWNWDRVIDMGRSWHVFDSPQNHTPEGSAGNKHDVDLYYPPAIKDWAEKMRKKGYLK